MINDIQDSQYIHLFKSSEFITLSNDNNGLILSRVEKDHQYNPANGALIKDVNIYKNTLIDSIHITGKSYCLFKPNKNMVCCGLSLVNLQKTQEIVELEKQDVLFKFWKFAVIKRQYYYYSKPSSINRCYFSTPISILNCHDGVGLNV
jgi:uncharacterized protein YsxB (DUF464 family)